jgi:hypothetical protein
MIKYYLLLFLQFNIFKNLVTTQSELEVTFEFKFAFAKLFDVRVVDLPTQL